jgi:molecular chaperone DnaJ
LQTGVDKKATAQQIKTKYRALARKFHPDKVQDIDKDKAEQRFMKIAQAYEVLSDEEKRKKYDMFGPEGAIGSGGRRAGGGGQNVQFNFGGGANPFGGGPNVQFDFGDFAGKFFLPSSTLPVSFHFLRRSSHWISSLSTQTFWVK